MIRFFARVICLAGVLLSTPVIADAPVIEDAENFAVLEEQPQATEELPVAHDSYTIRDGNASEPALAHADTGNTSGNTELLNKIQGLQQDLQDLRGQLEVQAQELADLKQQQLSFYQDLDTRLNHAVLSKNAQNIDNSAHPTRNNNPPSSLKQAKAEQSIAPSPDGMNGPRPNPADEQIGYLAAYELVKKQQFPQATLALHQFLAKYPHGGYSANAHYWLGELYLSRKDYTSAITQFDTVIQSFKSSSKYAPSRLKLGYALADSGRVGEAKEQLLAVMKHYPDTASAHLAEVKLETLGG